MPISIRKMEARDLPSVLELLREFAEFEKRVFYTNERFALGNRAAFVEGLDIGEDAKARLVALTPATYTGLADALVDEL